MIDNETLITIETFLKEVIRDGYETNFTFNHGTKGDRILQAARIALLVMPQVFETSYEVGKYLTGKRAKHSFLKDVNQFVQEPRKLQLLTERDHASLSKRDKQWNHDVVMPWQGVLLCNSLELSGDDSSKTMLLENLVRGEITPESELSESRRSTIEAYQQNVISLYEMVRTGKITNWRRLNRDNIAFLSWSLNARTIIQYVTEKYLLPRLSSTLEDIPLGSDLKKELSSLKIPYRGRYKTLRGLFLFGYPIMARSPHWHKARWSWSTGVPQGMEETYSKFRRRYMFEHRLHCQTRGDVLGALNDEARLREALEQEKLVHEAYFARSKHFYRLVKDLPGPRYDIDPWELSDEDMPHGVFKNKSGAIRRDNVQKYLLWVKSHYGLNANQVKSRKATHGIPHYAHFRDLFTANEIRRNMG